MGGVVAKQTCHVGEDVAKQYVHEGALAKQNVHEGALAKQNVHEDRKMGAFVDVLLSNCL